MDRAQASGGLSPPVVSNADRLYNALLHADPVLLRCITPAELPPCEPIVMARSRGSDAQAVASWTAQCMHIFERRLIAALKEAPRCKASNFNRVIDLVRIELGQGFPTFNNFGLLAPAAWYEAMSDIQFATSPAPWPDTRWYRDVIWVASTQLDRCNGILFNSSAVSGGIIPHETNDPNQLQVSVYAQPGGDLARLARVLTFT